MTSKEQAIEVLTKYLDNESGFVTGGSLAEARRLIKVLYDAGLVVTTNLPFNSHGVITGSLSRFIEDNRPVD